MSRDVHWLAPLVKLVTYPSVVESWHVDSLDGSESESNLRRSVPHDADDIGCYVPTLQIA